MGEPVTDIDKRMARTLRSVHRGRWVALSVLLALLTAGLAALAWTAGSEASRLQSSCRFYRDLGTAPVTLSPPTGQLGTALIIDARHAYAGQRCGSLPPPSAALVQLAARYRLRLPLWLSTAGTSGSGTRTSGREASSAPASARPTS